MAEQVLGTVTVQFLQGQHGNRWQVATQSGVTLCTAGCGAGNWAAVEQHVRAAMGQQTPAEQFAAQLFVVVEQHGTTHPVGAAAYGALIAAGLE